MSTKFVATAAPETFVNDFHVVDIDIDFNGATSFSGAVAGDPISEMIDIASPQGPGGYFFTVFDGNSVDYSSSTAPISIDLRGQEVVPGIDQGEPVPPQSGGFANGDVLVEMGEIFGSNFNDVIRGSDQFRGGGEQPAFNDPGNNILIGGGGSDVLEGRGGADLLLGGTLTTDSSNDYASYESSPAAVTVRLAGVGSDTQTAIATGGDADGDALFGIESLIGSRFDDHLTGNSLDNVLAGGLGNDVLDGKGGNDTVDYSRDHLFDQAGGKPDSADGVVVKLGLNGANGTGAEFFLSPNGQVESQGSQDTLISIENVIGTDSGDAITGNEQDNVIDGRGGTDQIDGGFGDDTLFGGSGVNTVSYVSHDSSFVPLGEINTITLGLNGATGSFVRSEFSFPGRTIVETDTLSGFQNVQGSSRSETIIGNEADNVIDARGGNDLLDGGVGNDTLIGGDGTDTVSYASHDDLLLATSGVTITLGLGTSNGTATDSFVRLGRPALVETDILRSIENVNGSTHGDTIIGNEQDNVLDGRAGNDALDGGLGNDTLIGGGDNDTAVYASHDNTPLLFGEQDVISLGLNGADGSFTRSQLVSLRPVQFQVVEQDVLRGISNVLGSNHSETINGNEQTNILIGRGGNDNLNGGDGDDSYNYIGSFGQNFGNDRIFDSSGNDAIAVTNFSDVVDSHRDGNDLVLTLVVDGTTTVAGTIRVVDHFDGHQVEKIADSHGNSMVLATGLTGGSAPGIITGGNTGETLDGKGGDDFLFGGNGSDRLIGGDGNDRLTGGNGQDTFVFAAGFGHDTITDLTPADRIEFDGHMFRNFQAIQAASQQVGRDTVITLDDQDSITLQNVDLSSLHAHDFIIN